jgi:hypothetical protein
MTLHTKAGLSAVEIRDLEQQLISRGYRPIEREPMEMKEREFSVHAYFAGPRSPAESRWYSICWRN